MVCYHVSQMPPISLCILKSTCYIHDELHFTFQFVVLSKYHDKKTNRYDC
jgi:hypothetical protein